LDQEHLTEHPIKTINLLPNKQTQSTQENILTVISGLAMVAVILLGGASLYFWYDTGVARSQIATKESEKKELLAEIDQTKDQRLELAYIVDRQKVYDQLETKSTDYDVLLDRIAEATPEKLRIENLTFKNTGEINLSGLAASRDDIAAFTEHLSQTEVFTDVTVNQTDNQTDAVHYTVAMRVKP
jgi:Tfp pilus assembly protein PilN